MSSAAANSPLLAWARLLRIPNVFTVFADVLMGHWFVAGGIPSSQVLGWALLATPLMYLSGMVLNDCYDVQEDRRDRPWRPIPSGAISLKTARVTAYVLLFAGIAAGLKGIASAPLLEFRVARFAAGVLLVLTLAILLYNAWAKRTWLGPWVMGGCRLLDVVWGMTSGVIACSAGMIQPDPSVSVLQGTRLDRWGFTILDDAGWMIAAGIGIYIAGVTYLARNEAGSAPRVVASNAWLRVFVPAIVLSLGLIIIALFPQCGAYASGARRLAIWNGWPWPILMLALGWSIIRHALKAAARADGLAIQIAVKRLIVSLIVLDAVICMAVRAPVTYAVIIVLMIVPMLVLGRWVYST